MIGSTRFFRADPDNRRLELGHTWYARRFQRSAVNSECKLLLLGHAFERLEAIAVELRTHWHNHASRNAIARLGAKQDGVLRHHTLSADGIYRTRWCFPFSVRSGRRCARISTCGWAASSGPCG